MGELTKQIQVLLASETPRVLEKEVLIHYSELFGEAYSQIKKKLHSELKKVSQEDDNDEN